MPSRRRSMFAIALLAAACVPAVIAAAQLSPDTPHGRPGLFQALSPEQRMMMFVDMRKDTAGMTSDQRHAYRENQRQKFAAMTGAEKQQLSAKLQSEWDSLSPDQKADFEQRFAEWRVEHANRRAPERQGAE